MKLHGYCYKCRKIKRVTVSGATLAVAQRKQVLVGVCDDCK